MLRKCLTYDYHKLLLILRCKIQMKTFGANFFAANFHAVSLERSELLCSKTLPKWAKNGPNKHQKSAKNPKISKKVAKMSRTSSGVKRAKNVHSALLGRSGLDQIKNRSTLWSAPIFQFAPNALIQSFSLWQTQHINSVRKKLTKH